MSPNRRPNLQAPSPEPLLGNSLAAPERLHDFVARRR
jgi:hypothetical protein